MTAIHTLEIKNFAKRFGPVAALAGASCAVRTGELVGLIGPNGAGKTTLMECAAGLLLADAGIVLVDGASADSDLVRASLFYLPDAIVPWPDQRVRDVLAFIAALFGSSRASADELMEALSLSALAAQRVNELSKGQRKRLLIAAGLLTPAPFLLLDEPFDGLDLRQLRDVAALLRGHAARGRGLCLSIHQLNDAARVCDRLVLLADGRTVADGTLDELRSRASVNSSAGIEEIFLALT